MTYLTYNVNYLIYKEAYSLSRVLNRAIYRVIILPYGLRMVHPYDAFLGWIAIDPSLLLSMAMPPGGAPVDGAPGHTSAVAAAFTVGAPHRRIGRAI